MNKQMLLRAISPEGIKRQTERALVGRTHEELGEKVGVKRQAVGRWLKKEGSISVENLRALYSVDCRADALYTSAECVIVTGSDGRKYVCEVVDDIRPGELIFSDGVIGYYRYAERDIEGGTLILHLIQAIDNTDNLDVMPDEPTHRVIGTLHPIPGTQEPTDA